MRIARATRLAKFQPITMQLNLKITDLKLIDYLNYIHKLFLNEYELIQQENIH